MRLWDTGHGYGWISIALHWVTGAVILVLWYTGSISQLAAEPQRYADLIRTHMSFALSAYVLLWARVVWRLAVGHPGPGPRQHGLMMRLGKITHYVLVLAVAVMLVSGPLMVWTGGGALRFFDLAIPSPIGGPYEGIYETLRATHGFFGAVIIIGVSLHVLAVIMHVAIMRDGSFDRIMVADRPAEAGGPTQGNERAMEADQGTMTKNTLAGRQ
jgi:cytochrome b561